MMVKFIPDLISSRKHSIVTDKIIAIFVAILKNGIILTHNEIF